MNKVFRLAGFLGIFWLGCSAPLLAHVRWAPIMLTDKGLFSFDPESVARADRITRVRSLMDYKVPQEGSDGRHHLSTVNELQINCRSQEARIMHTTYYSDARAGGQEVRKEGMVRDWLAIQPDTVIDRIAKRVC